MPKTYTYQLPPQATLCRPNRVFLHSCDDTEMPVEEANFILYNYYVNALRNINTLQKSLVIHERNLKTNLYHDSDFIPDKTYLNLIKHCCSCFKHYLEIQIYCIEYSKILGSVSYPYSPFLLTFENPSQTGSSFVSLS